MRLRQNTNAAMDKVYTGSPHTKQSAADYINEILYRWFPADGTVLSTNHWLFAEWQLPREFYEKHFRILSIDTSNEVRRRIAYNIRHSEGDYFRQLEISISQDGSAEVRQDLIGRYTDESILRKFLGDTDETVKNIAAKELKSRVITR